MPHAIEVSHRGPGSSAPQGLRNGRQLKDLVGSTEAEVKTCNGQVVLPLNFRNEATASGYLAGKLEIAHLRHWPAAEYRVAVPRDARNPSILLNRDVIMTGQSGYILDLRALVGTTSSKIDFLQAD